MKKTFTTIFGIILVLFLLGILAWNMLPTILSNHLSKSMNVPVSIADIRFSTSKIQANIVRFGNPKGYDRTPYALSINKLILDLPFFRLLDRHIVIDKVWLKDVHVGLEFDSPLSKDGNWTTIIENISKSLPPQSRKAKEGTLLIKKLIITNLNTTVAYKTGKKSNYELQTIENIELKNISSEGSFPTKQIVNIVIKQILRDVLTRAAVEKGLSPLKDQTKKGIDTFKKLFSKPLFLDDEESYTRDMHEEDRDVL